MVKMRPGKTRRKTLRGKFFNRSTLAVAKSLLGKFLVRRFPRESALTRQNFGGKFRQVNRRKSASRLAAMMITAVEAYDGFGDRASHASRGKTKRNAPMFGKPGHWYVYFTYGVHWMLNIVTREKGYPAAVLIRGVIGASGPGKLTELLKIDGKLNGKPATKKSGLWIEDRGVKIPASKIKKGPRVGVNYAGPYWSKRHLRFWFVVSNSRTN